MGFFSAIKKMFGSETAEEQKAPMQEQGDAAALKGVQAPGQPETPPQKASETESPEAAPQQEETAAAEAVSPAGIDAAPSVSVPLTAPASPVEEALTLRLREAEPRLSVWLGIVLEGVDTTGDLLWQRLAFLLGALEAPPQEAQAFVDDFRAWTQRMEYRQVEEFRSELQYRLALALDLEDEEDERNRLFIKIT